jgi:hypothetical protein
MIGVPPPPSGNPAAGILLLIAGLVGFLALVSGNLDRWIGKATGSTPGVEGTVFGLSGPTAQSALSGGSGSSSSAAANPRFGLGTPGGSHLQ